MLIILGKLIDFIVWFEIIKLEFVYNLCGTRTSQMLLHHMTTYVVLLQKSVSLIQDIAAEVCHKDSKSLGVGPNFDGRIKEISHNVSAYVQEPKQISSNYA